MTKKGDEKLFTICVSGYEQIRHIINDNKHLLVDPLKPKNKSSYHFSQLMITHTFRAHGFF